MECDMPKQIKKNKEEFSLKEFLPILKKIIKDNGCFKLYPKGTSMLPLLRQKRDAVVLEEKKKDIQQNDIVLYQRANGDIALHRVIYIKGKEYWVSGDHQIYEEKIFYDQILSVVSYIYRNEKEIYMSNWRIRLYFFIWRSKIIRKCYLKFEKMIKWTKMS